VIKHAFKLATVAAAFAFSTAATAVPIVYEGVLTPGVTAGGFVNDPSETGSPNDDFWSFFGTEGSTVTITVNRLTADLDPAMYLYSGVGADTGLLTFLTSADDNYLELPGFSGPFADPQIVFVLPATGLYTLQVWDFLSGPQVPGGFCYQITLNREPTGPEFGCNNVPEPTPLALFGLSLAGLAGTGAMLRRRRPEEQA